jgi:hypothetical protein
MFLSPLVSTHWERMFLTHIETTNWEPNVFPTHLGVVLCGDLAEIWAEIQNPIKLKGGEILAHVRSVAEELPNSKKMTKDNRLHEA